MTKESEERSCYNCHNFRAKIPIVKPKNSKESKITTTGQMLLLRLNYRAATAYCRAGNLLNTNCRNRNYKNVLNHNANHNLLSYRAALKCPDYELEEQ